MTPIQAISQVLGAAFIDASVQRATFYASPKYTIKATRRFRPRKNDAYESYVLTLGVPNYAEREFIKKCKKAGEPFPVKKIQLRFYKKKGTP